MSVGDDTARNLKIAYIGGGSLNWAHIFMNDMARETRLGGHVDLFDIDPEAAQLNERIGARVGDLPEVDGRWTFAAVETLEAALAGADCVVISILPGDFDDMASDVHVPERLGIVQPVGDTTGPGGLIRALRAIPMFEEFAHAIRRHCPRAWVINFTNPMTVLVRTLYRVFPKIRAWGCCHEVFNTQKLLAAMLADHLGRPVGDFRQIQTNVLGINHFTWIDRASWRGIDVLPVWAEYAQRHRASGWPPDGRDVGDPHSNCFDCLNRVKFDLWTDFGIIAAAGDRHLAEFLPQAWYAADNEAWGFGLTPVDFRIAKQDRQRAEAHRLADGETAFVLHESGEAFSEQLVALCGLGDIATNVNLPNRGQIQGLPEDAVVETNAVFSADGVAPIAAGRLPRMLENRVLTHVQNQELTVEAALGRDLELAYRVFMHDPALAAVGLADGRALFDDMVRNTAHRLPKGLGGRDDSTGASGAIRNVA